MYQVSSVGTGANVLPVAQSVQNAEKSSSVPDEEEGSSVVRISALGSQLAAKKATNSSNSTEDIDNSNLPDQIQKTLKQIRELQKKMQELEQKIAALEANQSLAPEEKQRQLQQLQIGLEAIQHAMTSSMNLLNKSIRELKLTKEQKTVVAGLLSRGA